MQKTLAAVLTDASARQDSTVAAKLGTEMSAGYPWYTVADK